MGKKTGAYTPVFTTDVESLRPENLKQFDAICFNNTQGVITKDNALRESLLAFVASGKGFVAFHAGAAATFVQYPVYDQYPPFGEMVGGYEDGGHPWGPKDTIRLRVEDPKNPINAVFKGQDFTMQHQVMQFRHGYSREKLHVLLSIDVEKSDYDPKRRASCPSAGRIRIFRWPGSRPTTRGGFSTASTGTTRMLTGIRRSRRLSGGHPVRPGRSESG